MGYRLKDQELQKKLDEISDGDFSRRFVEASDTFEGNFGRGQYAPVFFGKKDRFKGPRFVANIYADDVERTPDYDPNAWNNFPEVNPPAGVWMRIECRETDSRGFVEEFGLKSRYVRSENSGEWFWTGIDGDWLDDAAEVIRFRPWDDEEQK